MCNRTAAAAAIVTAHLNDRAAGIIRARVCATGVTVFEVKGTESAPYVVTVAGVGAPVDTCTCRDHAARRCECKHLKAVKSLVLPPAIEVTLVAEFAPVAGWLSDRRPVARAEWTEEV